MVAFIQPFRFDGAGGGARILRSLTGDASRPFMSIVTCSGTQVELRHNEVHVPQRPYFGSFIERASRHLGGILEYAKPLLQHRFKRRIKSLFIQEGVTAVHCIPHGMDFWYVFQVARDLGLPYVINVHDDLSYNLSGDPMLAQAEEKLGVVWREADHRFVISEPMGREFERRYGKRSWTRLTDGVATFPDEPASRNQSVLRLYFMGSVHLTYERNFLAIVRALDNIQRNRPDLNVEFVVRGGMPFKLPDLSFPVTTLGWGIQEDIDADMESASMLYFPLPFKPEYQKFTRYSLSTKMITYLGSGLPILYHGPKDAAACELLGSHNAAFLALSDNPDQVARCLQDVDNTPDIVRNALALGRSEFQLETQRHHLWSTLDTLIQNYSKVYANVGSRSAAT